MSKRISCLLRHVYEDRRLNNEFGDLRKNLHKLAKPQFYLGAYVCIYIYIYGCTLSMYVCRLPYLITIHQKQVVEDHPQEHR